MNFLEILAYCITRFGWISGLNLFIKLKLKRFNFLRVPGVSYPITLRKGTSDHSVFLQIFLKEEYKFSYEPDIKTIIDAGANAGYATIYFANLFKEANIIAIEPAPENYTLLKKNTSAIPKVNILTSALWSKSTLLQIQDNGGHWVYSVDEDPAGTTTGISISDIMKLYQIEVIDILKIDIEGSEKNLFQHNYEGWLPLTRYLIVETHDRLLKDCTKTVFKALEGYNFSCHLNGENFIFVNEDLTTT